MGGRQHRIVTVEFGAAAARHDAAEGLDVLVEVVGPIEAEGDCVVRVQAMIAFGEKRVGFDAVRDIARSNGKPAFRRICAGVPSESRRLRT